MKFVIRCLSGRFPYPDLGPRGSELAGYIPPGVAWRQLNYGQGEGQVEIGGCEWGIYQTGKPGELAIQLHVGDYPAPAALELSRLIAGMLCREEPFEIWGRGTDEPIAWEGPAAPGT